MMLSRNELSQKWEKEFDIITESYISDYTPHRIRWKITDDGAMLQQELFVKVKFSKAIWRYGDFIKEDSDYLWFDVEYSL